MPLPRDENYSGPHIFREFDYSPFEANAWLEETGLRFDCGPNPAEQSPTLQTQRQYAALSAHSEYNRMVELLRQYIDAVIFEPLITERDWWVVTSVPATGKRRGYRRLSCMSIQWIEMMLFSERVIDGVWTVGGFINVPLSGWGGMVRACVRSAEATHPDPGVLVQVLGDVGANRVRQPRDVCRAD